MKICQLLPGNPFQKLRKKNCTDKIGRKLSCEKTSSSEGKNSSGDSLIEIVNIHSTLDVLFDSLRTRANNSPKFKERSIQCGSIHINFPIFTDEHSVNDCEQYGSLKPRTRIRTNPWIQNPCSTELYDSDQKFDIETKIFFERNSFKTDEQILLADDNIPKVSENCEDPQFFLKKSDKNKNKCEASYRWSIISEGDVTIDFESGILDSLGEDYGKLDLQYDAEYEDNLDQILEQGMSEREYTRVSIEDLLEDFIDVNEHNLKRNDDVTLIDNSDSENDSSSANSSDELSCNSSVMETVMVSKEYTEIINPMHESVDAGYASLTRDGSLGSDQESENGDKVEEIIDKTSDEICLTETNINVNSDDAPIASGRTLPEVKASLQQKIDQLRLEKRVVQSKIYQAKEEERARMEQRKKMKGKSPSERKMSLFKTLVDLKQRLENQTIRIQRSYSAVLTMQKNFPNKKSKMLCQPTLFSL